MTSPYTNEKLMSVYSERTERDIAVRVKYTVQEAGSCKVYQLQSIEDLG